jgi:hypothetical protein
MRIIDDGSIFDLEHKQKNEEFLSLVFSEIFTICSEDKELQNDKQLELTSKIKELENRISKQNEILSKVEDLKKVISGKSSSLDDENAILKERLLEMLGSE